MSASFIQTLDTTAKTLVYTKFAPFLDLTVSTTEQNKNLVFAPKEVAQRKIAEKRGESSVEFFNLWRDPVTYDWSRNNSVIARRGLSLNYSTSLKESIITAKAVPAVVNYNFYVWSKDFDKIAQVNEAYLLWVHSTPQLNLNYIGTYPMSMYLKFGTPVDETDYDIYQKGLYFVYKFPITMDGWILSTFNTDTVLEIILDIFLREGASPNYVDTLLEEFIITATSE